MLCIHNNFLMLNHIFAFTLPIHEKKDFCGGDGFFKNAYKIPKFGGKTNYIQKNWRRYYLQKLHFFSCMTLPEIQDVPKKGTFPDFDVPFPVTGTGMKIP